MQKMRFIHIKYTHTHISATVSMVEDIAPKADINQIPP